MCKSKNLTMFLQKRGRISTFAHPEIDFRETYFCKNASCYFYKSRVCVVLLKIGRWWWDEKEIPATLVLVNLFFVTIVSV